MAEPGTWVRPPGRPIHREHRHSAVVVVGGREPVPGRGAECHRVRAFPGPKRGARHLGQLPGRQIHRQDRHRLIDVPSREQGRAAGANATEFGSPPALNGEPDISVSSPVDGSTEKTDTEPLCVLAVASSVLAG